MNPRQPINENVQEVMEGLIDSIIDLNRLDEARNDRLKRLQKVIASKHFGILSPHRSFAQQGEKGQILPEKDPAIYKGDQTAAKMVGAKPWGGKIALRAGHNAAAWKQAKAMADGLGFNAIPVVGGYEETGGKASTEASLVIPGQGHGDQDLTAEIMGNLNRRYNQDSFIYAGPETKGEIHLYVSSNRSKGGLPKDYDNHFSIGKAEQPSDIKVLLQRLIKSQGDPDKILGLTQPVRHGEKDPGRPTAKVPVGKGKGIAITQPEENPGKSYLP